MPPPSAPRSHPRSRSRSPCPPTKSSTSHRTNTSGFRWKEKPRRTDENTENLDHRRAPERNYRDRRDNDGYHDGGRGGSGRGRDTGDGRGDYGGGDGRRRGDGGVRAEKRRPEPNTTTADSSSSIASKFGSSSSAAAATAAAGTTSKTITTTTTTTPKPPPSTRAPTGPMIVIKINDRLGTTTKVPCLSSDSIGDLKKLVAMRIGRKPHEIMLKRQGERPFKDFLTLEDYGVGDGVQLDLELDTGD